MIPGMSALLDPPKPEKAYLIAEQKTKGFLATYEKVKLQFNPSKLAIGRTVSWAPERGTAQAYKAMAYSGSSYDTLSIDIILDTTIPSDLFGLRAAATQLALMVPGASPGRLMDMLLKSGPDSVLKNIDLMLSWTYPKYAVGTEHSTTGSLRRPPAVAFIWGSEINFFGAIESIAFDLTLFDTDGTPVRAEGTVKLVGRREGKPAESKVSDLADLFTDVGETPKKPVSPTTSSSNLKPGLFG